MPTDSFQIERPAMKPAAPASRAVSSWPTNVPWSTPAESSAHGTPSASVRLAQAAASPGILELEVARAALLGEQCPLPDQVGAARGEGRRILVVRRVGQHLDDEQQLGGGAVGRGLADHRGVRALRVLAVGAQADEELGPGAAEPAHAGGPDARQELGARRPPGAATAPLRSSETRRPVRAGKAPCSSTWGRPISGSSSIAGSVQARGRAPGRA